MDGTARVVKLEEQISELGFEICLLKELVVVMARRLDLFGRAAALRRLPTGRCFRVGGGHGKGDRDIGRCLARDAT